MRRRALPALAALAVTPLARPALAQAPFPNRPLRMIVPLPAGGATDIWARLVAEPMGAFLGQPVVIDNRAGAGGMIGSEAVENAPPDGYTLLFHIASFVQTPVVLRRWPYQPLEDFCFIGKFGTTPLPFCVRADLPVGSMAEFVAYAKDRQLNYGTYSPGSSGHAFGQLISDLNGLGMQAVHYRGEAPMLQDVLGGRIPCAFHSMTASGEAIKAGRIRPLASLGNAGIPSLPAVPTFAELGLARLTCTTWIGISGPKGLPEPVAARLTEAVVQVMAGAELRQKLADLASYPPPAPLTGAAFASYIGDYVKEWTGVARAAGIVAS